MLAIAPSGAVRVDVGFGTLLEGDRLCLVEPLLSPLSASRFDRINALMPLASRVQCLRAGFLQAIERGRSQSHPTWSTIEHETEHPVFRAGGRDPQIEPTAIRIHAGFFRLLN